MFVERMYSWAFTISPFAPYYFLWSMLSEITMNTNEGRIGERPCLMFGTTILYTMVAYIFLDFAYASFLVKNKESRWLKDPFGEEHP